MRVIVDVPDEFYRQLYSEAADTPAPGAGLDGVRTTAEDLLVSKAVAGKDVVPGNRFFVVQGTDLVTLEERLGGGHLFTPTDLVTRVSRLARVQFGDYEITLSQAQLEEMAWRAKKQGITVEKLVQRTWQKMQELFFQYATNGR